MLSKGERNWIDTGLTTDEEVPSNGYQRQIISSIRNKCYEAARDLRLILECERLAPEERRTLYATFLRESRILNIPKGQNRSQSPRIAPGTTNEPQGVQEDDQDDNWDVQIVQDDPRDRRETMRATVAADQ